MTVYSPKGVLPQSRACGSDRQIVETVVEIECLSRRHENEICDRDLARQRDSRFIGENLGDLRAKQLAARDLKRPYVPHILFAVTDDIDVDKYSTITKKTPGGIVA